MDLILCHTTADFDALGAAVGLTLLRPGARIVLTGGAHLTVREFLALHRDEYALIERRAVNPDQIRSLWVVDTQSRSRLGKAAEWLDRPGLEIGIYDHHPGIGRDIPATFMQIETVGATSTLIVEQLQAQQINLTPAQATVMALGIHVDTGSLTFDHTTPRDALALAWLMSQGASLRAIAEYIEPGLPPHLQELLTTALERVQTEIVRGYSLSWVILKTDEFVPGLSSLVHRLMDLTESDAILLANQFCKNAACRAGEATMEEMGLAVIGRSRIEGTDLNSLFQLLGGGGHPRAAAVTTRSANPQTVLTKLFFQLKQQIPHPQTARDLMSSPVRTILPDTTIDEAQRILLRYGHSGLSVVDATQALVGIISRRDIDIALHHGFSHAPVKGYMTTNLKVITPEALLPEIESLMVTYDIGRLPVLEQGQLVGIVTRTDVLRQLHQQIKHEHRREFPHWDSSGLTLHASLDRLLPELQHLLTTAAQQAEQRGWHLYLVGGAVRDLLLANLDEQVGLSDIDLVVDGFHRSADVGAGVELARSLQHLYPQARLEVHGRFQTAALLWHKDAILDSLWIDIATARTEFYPYPAANPEVEASSIRQDLYRRDFTINALALRLTCPHQGEILDFFGGWLDLQAKQIRVLHANSFIEDPTRIYRAVRFAVRLGFQIDPQTEGYIRHAIASGIYNRLQGENSKAPALQTRLKMELKYILQSAYWKPALTLLSDLGALQCIHASLEMDRTLWWQVRLADRWLRRFDPTQRLAHWQMLLEVLLAKLAPEYRGDVAIRLQLPLDSIERLQQLASIQAKLAADLVKCDRPSQIVQLLTPYDLATLLLVTIQSPRSLRRPIWQYLTNWSLVPPPLDGNALKALGYKPSKQFKQILETLLAARLDGEIDSEYQQILAFLEKNFPTNYEMPH
ncbi:MAG: CBS domain-containing protein [Scytolyngbya sp. HA4215-MV1]|nr:CBS domain-containing protein [Scytolyngbya sp. HA4215-MV1]